jgi:hypothetical protein
MRGHCPILQFPDIANPIRDVTKTRHARTEMALATASVSS